METKDKKEVRINNEFGKGWVLKAIFGPALATVIIMLIVFLCTGFIFEKFGADSESLRKIDETFEMISKVGLIILAISVVLLVIVFLFCGRKYMKNRKNLTSDEKIENSNLNKMRILKIFIEFISFLVVLGIMCLIAVFCIINQDKSIQITQMSTIATFVLIIVGLAILTIFWYTLKYISVGKKEAENKDKENK